MKRSVYISIIVLVSMASQAQNLMDVYKAGTIKLVPDTTYALANNWNDVFATYYDTLYGKPMGNRKSIVIKPDGSLIVNHAYKNYYSLFNAKGNFVKEFGIYNGSGKQFKKANHIVGVINDNTFFTGLDNMGKMTCFDFNGNFKKTLTLDYMTRDMIALGNDKIAVVGWVIWAKKFRDFVAIVDYQTNEQKVIWEHFTERETQGEHSKMFNYSYHFKERGAIMFNTMPYSESIGLSSPPKIAYVNSQLVVAIPSTGEINIYNTNGKLVNESKIEWASGAISVEEQKQIQQKAIDQYKNIEEPHFASWVSPEENKKALETIISKMEEDLKNISTPIPVPVFSNIIKDSDDNLLFFEIPEEEGGNLFHVWIYQNNGQFVCQSRFECDDYNLSITPSKMVFHNGYIYALQTLKETEGNPLRLVRFKLKAK